ncbi:MAG TPA: hypothetical protein ENG66_07410 [Thermococcus sp.]|nr:hypothetical protein [Thermococcus sp.]
MSIIIKKVKVENEKITEHIDGLIKEISDEVVKYYSNEKLDVPPSEIFRAMDELFLRVLQALIKEWFDFKKFVMDEIKKKDEVVVGE